MKKIKPKLIAIVGGSGAGKTWLASQLEQRFAKNSMRLSLDDFYRDRSHLPAKRRGALNFDHPRSIDWENVERVLKNFSEGKAVELPRYDFATHTRSAKPRSVRPKPLVIVDGLWLLRRPAIRKLFSCGIFIECPNRTRLLRRLNRDLQERGRDAAGIRKQFQQHVAPMHERFVTPQQRRAHFVLKNPDETDVNHLAAKIKTLLQLN